MADDSLFGIKKEQSLDYWIDDVIAPINDVIYSISKKVNGVMREVLIYVH